jgi:hypothetical protein
MSRTIGTGQWQMIHEKPSDHRRGRKSVFKASKERLVNKSISPVDHLGSGEIENESKKKL